MKKSVFLIFYIFSFVAARSQNEIFQMAEFTDSRSIVLKYRILYPENYNPLKKYPLILFLHGAGERGDDNKAQLTHGALVWTEKLTANPAIVILPQCPKEDYWASVKFSRAKYPLDLDFNYSYLETNSLHAAVELVKSFIENKKADKHRIYITGMSMGGMGTFEAVYRYPKLFAAAMPICGGGDISSYGKKQAKVPFWIFHGSADGVVPGEKSVEMHKKLYDLGANVKYTEYPGVNHNSWDNVFKEENYPNWFFQFKK